MVGRRDGALFMGCRGVATPLFLGPFGGCRRGAQSGRWVAGVVPCPLTAARVEAMMEPATVGRCMTGSLASHRGIEVESPVVTMNE